MLPCQSPRWAEGGASLDARQGLGTRCWALLSLFEHKGAVHLSHTNADSVKIQNVYHILYIDPASQKFSKDPSGDAASNQQVPCQQPTVCVLSRSNVLIVDTWLHSVI